MHSSTRSQIRASLGGVAALVTAALACSLAGSTPPTAPPITQVIAVTQIVPVTQIIPVTQIVPAAGTPDTHQEHRPAAPGVYFVAGAALYWMDLDGRNLTTVIAALPGERQIMAGDEAHRALYLIRWEGDSQLIRVDLDRLDQITALAGPAEGGQGIALDSARDRLYLGLYYAGVFAAPLAACCQDWQQLVTADQLAPTYGQRGQLQLDAAGGWLYFRTTFNGGCNACRSIWRVRVDGTGLQRLIPANGGDALALDPDRGVFYFSDIPEEANTLKRAALDGSVVQTLLTLPPPYTYCREMALDAPHGRLYLSLSNQAGWRDRAIASVNVDGSDFRILYEVSGNQERDVTGGLVLWLNP